MNLINMEAKLSEASSKASKNGTKEQRSFETRKLNRSDPLSWALMPQFLERVRKFASEKDPSALVSSISEAFGQGSSDVYLIGVFEAGRLVGHFFAYLVSTTENALSCHVHQAEMDKASAEVSAEVWEEFLEWCKSREVGQVTAASSHRWKALCKRFGFEYKTTMIAMDL